MVDRVIEVAGLVKCYETVAAVDGISFSVMRGTTCALLGANGAGKTTTIAMLLGLLLPTQGDIRIFGENMLRHRHRVLPRINLTSPYVDLPQRLTVAENLSVYARLYGVRNRKARLAKLLADFDLLGFQKRRYGSLSAGQKTRVALAKALLNEPELLLLDEPTASLDPDTADFVRGYLIDYQQRTGATLFIASHNMPEVERLSDEVLMMRAGQIVDHGTPAALLARYGRDNMEEVFLDVARERRAARA